MQGTNQDVIVVMGGVLIALFVISVFFLVSALKKIDKITIIEERLNSVLDRIREVVDDVKHLLSNHTDLEKRISLLEQKVEAIEKSINEKMD
jgi:predicted  nucleic acid-binding Zn-ribbon protein